MELPLSITTSPNSRYNDLFEDPYLVYRYRGNDVDHRDNRGLREVMTRRLPLAYFHGILEGRYVPSWPVFIVDDNPQELAFRVMIDEPANAWNHSNQEVVDPAILQSESIRRAYATALVTVRLHQTAFRERVLRAYRHECAFCRLRHYELLEASHITPDSHLTGEPLVTNGLALCSLHHRAFDRWFVGLRPDFTIEVRPDILAEKDGPTLAHAIQGLHGVRISLPRKVSDTPDLDRVKHRYQMFREMADSSDAKRKSDKWSLLLQQPS